MGRRHRHLRGVLEKGSALVVLMLCYPDGSQPRGQHPRDVPALNWLDQEGEYFHHPVMAVPSPLSLTVTRSLINHRLSLPPLLPP